MRTSFRDRVSPPTVSIDDRGDAVADRRLERTVVVLQLGDVEHRFALAADVDQGHLVADADDGAFDRLAFRETAGSCGRLEQRREILFRMEVLWLAHTTNDYRRTGSGSRIIGTGMPGDRAFDVGVGVRRSACSASRDQLSRRRRASALRTSTAVARRSAFGRSAFVMFAVIACPGMLTTAMEPQPLTPPLKWAGGKRWQLPLLDRCGRHQHRRLVEPFCGGLAVPLGLSPGDGAAERSQPASGELLPLGAAWPVDRCRGRERPGPLLRASHALQRVARSRRRRHAGGRRAVLLPQSHRVQRALPLQPAQRVQRAVRPLSQDLVRHGSAWLPRCVAILVVQLRGVRCAAAGAGRLRLRRPAVRRRVPPVLAARLQLGRPGANGAVPCLAPGPVVLANQATPRILALYESLGYDTAACSTRRGGSAATATARPPGKCSRCGTCRGGTAASAGHREPGTGCTRCRYAECRSGRSRCAEPRPDAVRPKSRCRRLPS